MALTRFEKIALGIAGFTALGVSGSILAAPHAFYSDYGISLGNDVNLLNELRAPAACLAALGALMLAGIVRVALSRMSIIAAFTVYLAFPTGRLIGLMLDGMPSRGIVAAMLIELAIAGLCAIAFRNRLWVVTRESDHKRFVRS